MQKKYYHNKKNLYGIKPKREKILMFLIGRQIKDKKVLDVGCSTGYLGEKLEKLGAKVIGIDISPYAINLAKRVLTGAKVVDLNKGNLPFKSKSFDIIVASEVIEHLFRPVNTLKDLKRILKDDGEFIVSTPNFLYWANRQQFLFGKFRYTQSGMFDEGHVHFYTYQTLQEDLSQSGFNIIGYNHVFAGTDFLDFIRQKLPSLFAYQFVFLCQKGQ